jgi:hypothetical protein
MLQLARCNWLFKSLYIKKLNYLIMPSTKPAFTTSKYPFEHPWSSFLFHRATMPLLCPSGAHAVSSSFHPTHLSGYDFKHFLSLRGRRVPAMYNLLPQWKRTRAAYNLLAWGRRASVAWRRSKPSIHISDLPVSKLRIPAPTHGRPSWKNICNSNKQDLSMSTTISMVIIIFRNTIITYIKWQQKYNHTFTITTSDNKNLINF